jgi:hypothetical protein
MSYIDQFLPYPQKVYTHEEMSRRIEMLEQVIGLLVEHIESKSDQKLMRVTTHDGEFLRWMDWPPEKV